MGMFDFLKKSKAETPEAGMELPPIPKIEGAEGFPAAPEETPAKAETSLPPLPTEVPGEVPPKPEEKELEAPKIEMPELPETEEPKKIEAAEMEPEPTEKKEAEETEVAKPEFPTTPQLPSEEVVPEKVPPLEGLPEAPVFKAEKTKEVLEEPEEIVEAPEPIEEEELPATYVAPEEPAPRKVLRGPLFIRADKLRAVLDDIGQIKSKFKAEDDIFFRITDVKNAQDQKFEDFRQSLEDVQRKLLFVDRSLFEKR
jgi:hypothetical protein